MARRRVAVRAAVLALVASSGCRGSALDAAGARSGFVVSQSTSFAVSTAPIRGDLDVVTFYDYYSASGHTGLERAGESVAYLYLEEPTGQLSLILTHGVDYDTTGQEQGPASVEMDLEGVPTGATIAVADDAPNEFSSPAAGRIEGRWTFDHNSDGGVVTGLGGRWRITIAPRLTTGLSAWSWLHPGQRRAALDPTMPVTIESLD